MIDSHPQDSPAESALPAEAFARIAFAGHVAREVRREGIFVAPPAGTLNGVVEAFDAGILTVHPAVFGLSPHPFTSRVRRSGMETIRLLVAPSQLEAARRIERELLTDGELRDRRDACAIDACEPLELLLALASGIGREPNGLFAEGAADDDEAIEALRGLEHDWDMFGVSDRAAFAHGLASPAAPRTLEALAALDALCRPGPVASGLLALFLGEDPNECLAELSPEPIAELTSTRGVPVFHEQLEAVATRALGIPPLEAPRLRLDLARGGEPAWTLASRMADGLHRAGMTADSAAKAAVAITAYAPHTASRAHYLPWTRLVLSMASVAAHAPSVYRDARTRVTTR